MTRILGIALVPVLLLAACATTPYTQRSQLMLISSGEENQLGAQAFQQVLSKEKISRDPVLQAVVDRIGSRVANAARRPDFQWQFVVIDNSKTATAFALPGGKGGVYTG